jgi:hypothetical protein
VDLETPSNNLRFVFSAYPNCKGFATIFKNILVGLLGCNSTNSGFISAVHHLCVFFLLKILSQRSFIQELTHGNYSIFDFSDLLQAPGCCDLFFRADLRKLSKIHCYRPLSRQ